MNNQLEPAVAAYLDILHRQLSGLPRQKQQDVRAEVLQHIEAITDAALLLGDTPTEALRAALRQFGDPVKIGRQIAREWRCREWRRRGVILLKTLTAPVSYVGLAALGMIVLDAVSFNDAPWLQRAYWLIGLEAIIKLGQATVSMAGSPSPLMAGYGAAALDSELPARQELSLNFAALWCELKTSIQSISFLGTAALITICLAISSSVCYFPDEDYTYWLYRTGWLIGLDTLIRLFQERPGPFMAKRKARSRIFIELIQPCVAPAFRTSDMAVNSNATLKSGALPEPCNSPASLISVLSRINLPRLPLSYLSLGTLSIAALAILSWAEGWPDDYTFRLSCASWIGGLYCYFKWLLNRPEPFAVQQKARLKILSKWLQRVAYTALRKAYSILGTTISPLFIKPSGMLSDRRSVRLNAVCFLLPPLGLMSWLLLDSSQPVKARSAGRSAVRGTVVAFILFNFSVVGLAVHTAIFAIGNARLQPINPNRPFHSLRSRNQSQVR